MTDLATNKLVAEFAGTSIFLGSILTVANGQWGGDGWVPLLIGLALTIAIVFAGPISGGHFNPAVSLMFFLQKNANVDTPEKFGAYVIAQLAGAVAAQQFITQFNPNITAPPST